MNKFLKFLAGITLAIGASASYSAVMIHDYELNNSLTDALGGPSLVANGGALGATSYTFGANQGPSLSGGLVNIGNYSIELVFSFDTIGGYRKILDFKDRTSDNGFYNLGGNLNFFPVVTAPTATIIAGQMVHVILTRDSGSTTVTGYSGGLAGFSFIDSSNLATFTGPADIIHFFRDDFATGQGEASSGVVDFIRIYDGALTAADARCLQSSTPVACELTRSNNVPEPVSLALFGIAALGFGVTKRRRKS